AQALYWRTSSSESISPSSRGVTAAGSPILPSDRAAVRRTSGLGSLSNVTSLTTTCPELSEGEEATQPPSGLSRARAISSRRVRVGDNGRGEVERTITLAWADLPERPAFPWPLRWTVPIPFAPRPSRPGWCAFPDRPRP